AVYDTAWARNPIDAFVRTKLDAKGWAPSAPAEKRSRLPPVSLDMIGIPPPPAELDAFLGGSSPDAWRRVVERLLASPRYGERWGRDWLDVVRVDSAVEDT